METVDTAFWCPTALLESGWADGVRITVDAHGTIERLETQCEPDAAEVRLPGAVVPGMPNLHSHAFQRSIVGATQRHAHTQDSFWTWREAMYASLDRLGPAETEAIAAALYVELLEGGFTSIAEFHYVHHDHGGVQFADEAELSWRVLAASRAAGIGLTHLPVLYMTGGFDARPLGAAQARFGWSPGGILRLIERFGREVATDPDRAVGLALHSLRAVPPEALRDAVAGLRATRPEAPIHIHIAEQTAEVEQCLAARGVRPVAWLLEHAPVDRRWCLVHATHLDAHECGGLLEAGAVAGLCPTTEADLGDGLFPAEHWVAGGGMLGVGTDSHVGRDAADELRWLEYGQRLFTRRRNVLRWPGQAHTGAALWRAAATGGAQALGRSSGVLAEGLRADLVGIRTDRPGMTGLTHDALLDDLVFGGARDRIDTVVVGGRVVVRDGVHLRRPEIMARFEDALSRMRSGR
ncbi:MAG TPA: formimidoylglutamate deiminase [Deltaproteobacteria bacterium]|nr:formimidoylglutamate deiminase [Deltaproteobacteria bacterium]